MSDKEDIAVVKRTIAQLATASGYGSFISDDLVSGWAKHIVESLRYAQQERKK